MYRFRDTEPIYDFESWLPSSAMIYDNRVFEEEIEGYQTLYVEGREMLSVELETEKLTVGEYILTQRLPARILTVHYKLEDNNPESFQVKFNQLMKLLYRSKDVPIQFRDQKDLIYFGRFESSSTVEGKSNNVVSSYSIKCADPRKYSKEYVSNGKIVTYTPYEVVPNSIKCTLAEGVGITVKNGSKQMKLMNSNLKKGDIVEFRPQNGDVLINGKDGTIYLSWVDSNLEDFTIAQGDNVTSTNGSLEILYRTVML